MEDFVAEFRPRPRPQPVVEYPEGFVAELRPRRNPPVIEQCDSVCLLKGSHDPCPKETPMEYTDKDLINALTEKNFSKESITHLLENSIIQLVEKLLINRPILRIHGGVKVVLNDDDTPISLDLNRTFRKTTTSHKDRDLSTELDPSGFNVKLREDLLLENRGQGRGFDREENMLGAGCLQVGAVSPPTEVSGFRDDDARPSYSPNYEPDSSMVLSPSASDAGNSLPVGEAKKRRRDSDDESGYTSKDDLDTHVEEAAERASKRKEATRSRSVFNEYYCNGFDGKETLHEPDGVRPGEHSGSSADGSDDEDDELAHESRLVIDENPERASVVYPSMDVEDTCHPVKVVPNRNCEILRSSEHVRSKALSDFSESEELESLMSSDITDIDTDAPVDLSGDSDMNRGGLSVHPHPQSLVTKVQDGLKCKQCSAVLPFGQAVSEHALTMHNLFSCSFCFRTFTAKNNLKRHVRLHTGSRPYKCSQCPQTFARRDDLKGHVLRHDYSKPFRCSICHKGYTDRACVKNHMAKEHRSRLMHVCPTCGESFDTDESFTLHKQSHPELQQFSCKKCSFIGTNNLMTLKHNILHTHKLFSCKPCNAYFADPFDYTAHVRKHKKLQGFAEYICCFCDMTLSTYDQYVRHEYSHAQGKTHACKLCKKQFKNKSLLNEHCQSHQEPQSENIPIDSNRVIAYSEFAVVPKPPPEAVTALPIVEEAEYDEYPGQLLDLSMKKPSSPDFSGSFDTSRRVIGLSGDVPRNGYVAKPFTQRPNVQAAAPYKLTHHAVEEKTYRPVFNVRQENSSTIGRKSELKFGQPCVSDKQSYFEKGSLAERLSVTNRGSLRFSPYNVQKMYEFASKYIATRGPKTSPTVNTNLSPINCEKSLPSTVIRKEAAPVPMDGCSGLDTRRKQMTNFNHESASVVPTVVKTEINVDSDMEDSPSSSPVSSRSPNLPDEANLDAGAYGVVRGESERGKHHACDTCKEEFGTFADLEAHSVEAHKRYLCEHCLKTFTTRPNRDRHARVHTGDRPYKCDLCELAFFRGDDLKYHRTTRHPSAQPYVCTRCSVSFTWGRDLDRHIRHSKCKA